MNNANPNWREADQLAIYKLDRGVELVGATLDPINSGFQVRYLNKSAPPYVLSGYKLKTSDGLFRKTLNYSRTCIKRPCFKRSPSIKRSVVKVPKITSLNYCNFDLY